MEIWKDIPGYEGIYMASNMGRIKSSIRYHGKDSRILKQYSYKGGYNKVNLYKNKKAKLINVHVAIAMTFLNHKPEGYNIVVDHIDGNNLNNKVSNLQLISQRENLSKDKKGSSKYTGVSWCKKRSKWLSSIKVYGKSKHLGFFNNELEAHEYYKKALEKIQSGCSSEIIVKKVCYTSEHKGVHWCKTKEKWIARYYNGEKQIHLGTYISEEEAINSVNKIKRLEDGRE